MPTVLPLGIPVLYLATRAPTVDDDAATIGARAGYFWSDTASEDVWFCRDPATGAAEWLRLSYTAAQVLDVLLTVDGAGSGLDADLLDGEEGVFYQDAANLLYGILPSGRLEGSYAGVTGVGTLGEGTWQADTVAVSWGGTGATAFLANGLLVGAGTGPLETTPAPADPGSYLTWTGAAYAWGPVKLPDMVGIGIDVPLAPLHVKGSNGSSRTLILQDNSGNRSGIDFQDDTGASTWVIDAQDPSWRIGENGTALVDIRFEILAGGVVRIGNSITVGVGSAALPSFSFIGDVDTGIYRPAADEISVVTGGMERLRVRANGEISSPSQPCFLAYNSATDTDVTGNAATHTVVCDTEIYDQNADFASGTFTAPVTGRYDLRFQCRVDGLVAASIITVRIVTTARTYSDRVDGSFTGSWTGRVSAIADMAAGDTATFTVAVFGMAGNTADVNGGNAATLNTFVCGSLVA